MEWMFVPLQKYAVFSGRARRREYWMYALFLLIVGIVAAVLEVSLGWAAPGEGWGPLTTVLSLATFVPSLAVAVRRMHDIGRSGWWVLVGLIPLIGWIVMLVFFVQDSEPGANRFGPNPKEAGEASVGEAGI